MAVRARNSAALWSWSARPLWIVEAVILHGSDFRPGKQWPWSDRWECTEARGPLDGAGDAAGSDAWTSWYRGSPRRGQGRAYTGPVRMT
jgi:hypothetical protein